MRSHLTVLLISRDLACDLLLGVARHEHEMSLELSMSGTETVQGPADTIVGTT